MKILVIAAHPDDEVLGCGGTIAKLAGQGEEIHILILATGLASRVGFDLKRTPDGLKDHYKKARQAGVLLGAKNVNFAGFPDQKLDTLPLLEITQRIEAEIKTVQPRSIFTHHGGDLNMDHVIAFRATLTAARPTKESLVRAVYAYEVLSSTEWAFNKFAPQFYPNLFYDITGTIDKKIQAMKMYKTETREYPHPRSSEAILALAKKRGSEIGMAAAEAFETIWEKK